jgi:hypothetical protein
VIDTKLAQAIGREEGWGIPGNLPTRNNNPGDLRHAPGEMHPAAAPDAVGSFATAAEGWANLERQLTLYADRGLSVQDMIEDCYAPPSENDSAKYLANICAWVGCSPQTLVEDALKL